MSKRKRNPKYDKDHYSLTIRVYQDGIKPIESFIFNLGNPEDDNNYFWDDFRKEHIDRLLVGGNFGGCKEYEAITSDIAEDNLKIFFDFVKNELQKELDEEKETTNKKQKNLDNFKEMTTKITENKLIYLDDEEE